MTAYPTASQLMWAENIPGIARKWTMECSIANINDTNVAIRKQDAPQELVTLPGSLIVRQVHVAWQAQTTGAGVPLDWVKLYFKPALPYLLGGFTTTATLAHFDWQGELVVKWNEFADANVLLTVSLLAVAAANDDVWFWITGDYYAPATTFGTPSPVSLEGFKWPLTRR